MIQAHPQLPHTAAVPCTLGWGHEVAASEGRGSLETGCNQRDAGNGNWAGALGMQFNSSQATCNPEAANWTILVYYIF